MYEFFPNKSFLWKYQLKASELLDKLLKQHFGSTRKTFTSKILYQISVNELYGHFVLEEVLPARYIYQHIFGDPAIRVLRPRIVHQSCVQPRHECTHQRCDEYQRFRAVCHTAQLADFRQLCVLKIRFSHFKQRFSNYASKSKFRKIFQEGKNDQTYTFLKDFF